MTGGTFSPVVLWRRGTVPFAALRALSFDGTARGIAEVEEERRRRAALRESLLDRLHAEVPSAGAAARRGLLAVQRAVFNDRTPPGQALAVACQHVTGPALAELRDWLACRENETAVLAATRGVLAEELRAARSGMAALTAAPDFARGVQLSGRALNRKARAYAARVAPAGDTPKELRTVESTLVSLAYRSALKPSPFGSFTTVGLWPWDGDRAPEDRDGRRIARVNRMLVDWMISAACPPEAREIRLNNTALVDGDHLEVFVSGPYPPGDEGHFLTVPLDDTVRRVVDGLSAGPVPERVVLDRLVESGTPRDVAAEQISRLCRLGVCEAGPGVADQETELPRVLAEKLSGTHAGEVFRSLADTESRFGAASPAEREAMLDGIEARIDEVRQAAASVPPRDAVRTLVFEDLAGGGGPADWRPGALSRAARVFALLQRFLPVFDDSTLARIGLYRFFVQTFGEAGECRDVLALYQAFSALTPQTAGRVPRGAGDPRAAAIYRLRGRFATALGERLAGSPDTAALELDESWLREFCAGYPDGIRSWPSVTYLLQLLGAGDGAELVINEIRSGFGAFHARFCAVSDRGEQALRAAVCEHPGQTDLAAVLGLNYNLHPPLARSTVEYPGSRASQPDALTLRDLCVRAGQGRLELVSRRDGTPVTLVPLNALQPSAGPDLYRFLHLLTPTVWYRDSLWDMYLATRSDRESRTTALPRLTVGGVVLARRSWWLPAEAAGSALAPWRDDLDLMLAVERWRVANGLPRECFFRLDDRWLRIGGGPVADVAHRRARDYKPHYLDFQNPLLVKVFRAAVTGADAGVPVVLQECLPGTGSYVDGGGPCAAEELAVEFHVP